MARKGWDELKEPTRKRYLGSGAKQHGWSPAQTRAHYETGGNLKAFRGHAKTPESVSDIARSENPEQFRKYVEQRQNVSGGTWDREHWKKKYLENFELHFGSNPDYSKKRLKEHTQITDPADKYYIHTDELIKGANSSHTKLVKLAGDGTKDYGKRSNPFHYH